MKPIVATKIAPGVPFEWRGRVWTPERVDVKIGYVYVKVQESLEPLKLRREWIVKINPAS